MFEQNIVTGLNPRELAHRINERYDVLVRWKARPEYQLEPGLENELLEVREAALKYGVRLEPVEVRVNR